MPWSPGLIAALSGATGKPKLTLIRFPWANTPGQNTGTARSTWDGTGIIGLSPSAGFSMASQSVSIPDWSSNRGTLRIGLGGLSQSQWAAAEMPRGAVCQVRVQYPGMASAEDIFVGRVTAQDGIGPQSILQGWDLLSAASSRTAFIGADESELFYHCTPDSTHTDTLTALYTAGSSTTLTFSSPPQMEKETGGTGAVLVTPLSGATPFILTWTGTSGNQLTGVSTVGVYGTTAVNAAIGSTIQEVAWIDDTPVNAALKILTSTGTGTNGTHDTLPASWGFGFIQTLVNYPGFTLANTDMAPSSGTHDVYVVSTSNQAQGFSWLQDVLKQYACWLTVRQGQITARAAVDRWVSVPTAVMTLGNDNILRQLPMRHIWDPSSAVEYGRVQTKYGAGTVVNGGSTLPATRPAAQTYLTDYGYQLHQNEALIAAKLNERIGAWLKRLPTTVDLQVTLAAAQLCPGDWVLLGHKGIWTPSNTAAGAVYAMVGSISVDWQMGVVSLRLYIQHQDSEA